MLQKRYDLKAADGANADLFRQWSVLKVAEYKRAVESMLLNYCVGVDEEMVEHRVEHGFDVRCRLGNQCITLADELQNIMVQDRYDLKPSPTLMPIHSFTGVFDNLRVQ